MTVRQEELKRSEFFQLPWVDEVSNIEAKICFFKKNFMCSQFICVLYRRLPFRRVCDLQPKACSNYNRGVWSVCHDRVILTISASSFPENSTSFLFLSLVQIMRGNHHRAYRCFNELRGYQGRRSPSGYAEQSIRSPPLSIIFSFFFLPNSNGREGTWRRRGHTKSALRCGCSGGLAVKFRLLVS